MYSLCVCVWGGGYRIIFLRNFGRKLDASTFLGTLPVQPGKNNFGVFSK